MAGTKSPKPKPAVDVQDPRRVRKLLEEVERRRARAEKKANLYQLLPQQEAFIGDPSKMKAAVCTRRAGKTTALQFMMHEAAMKKPGVQIPYIAKTKGQAKRIIWLAFKEFSLKHDLGLKFHKNDLIIEYPNGSLIDLLGCDDEGDIEKLRGGKYPLAVLDEAQSYRDPGLNVRGREKARGRLQGLVEDILEPAMLDYNGTIVMTGTPNALCAGYFFDSTTMGGQTVQGEHPTGWSVHHWSVLDNIYLPEGVDPAAYVAKKRERLGPDNPTFLREWCGKWAYDGEAIIYRLNPDINVVDRLPDLPDWEYVLGMDLGYSSATAFVVAAYSVLASQVCLVESWSETKLIPSAVAARVEALRQRYDFQRIVADVGGLGKGYAEEMIQRFEIPIEPARKSQKLGYIELLNGDLRNGSLKIVRNANGDILDEMRTLQWNERRTGPNDVDDDHLTDAALYAWRECKQFLHEPEKEILPGSQEWKDRETEEIWAKDLARVNGEAAPWWEGLSEEKDLAWE